jgi:hypothetical protein
VCRAAGLLEAAITEGMPIRRGC